MFIIILTFTLNLHSLWWMINYWAFPTFYNVYLYIVFDDFYLYTITYIYLQIKQVSYCPCLCCHNFCENMWYFFLDEKKLLLFFSYMYGFFFINNICEEKVLRKFTNFNKMNNLLWPETIEHKKYHSISTNINLSSNHLSP